jgi:hypothetical protein
MNIAKWAIAQGGGGGLAALTRDQRQVRGAAR